MQPFEERQTKYFEIFNEATVFLCYSLTFVFTDLNSNNRLKINTGICIK